jgi:hypothetical protein
MSAWRVSIPLRVSNEVNVLHAYYHLHVHVEEHVASVCTSLFRKSARNIKKEN